MSWFTPKCPVDSETKEWIENAFGWLIEELGIDVLRSVEVVLPTEEFFADAFNGSRASIRPVLDLRVHAISETVVEDLCITYKKKRDSC